jgi:hypothetical protein
MKTIREQIDALRGSDDIKGLAAHLSKEMSTMTEKEHREIVGAAFALAALTVEAAGGDIRGATAAFFLGSCGNDMTEALAFMVQQKRRIDAEVAASKGAT